MFFEELVEQHGVHCFVAHGVSFSVSVAGHQIGIHLFYLFSHKAKLRDAIGVQLVRVAEGHRFQRQDRVAGFIHRFDVFLESRRGCGRAEMTTAIYDNCYACWNGCPTDAGDKRSSLCSFLADTNGIGFPAKTVVAYIDIVTARGEVDAGGRAQCDVVAARCIIQERIKTGRCVEVAGCVVSKRTIAGGRVEAAGCVVTEPPAGGRVLDAGGVVLECITAGGCVQVAGGIARKRLITDGRVVEPGGVAEKSCTADGSVVDTVSVAIKRIKAYCRVVRAGREAEKSIVT